MSAPVPIGIGIRGLGLGLDNIGNWLTHRMEKFSLKFKVGHKICNILGLYVINDVSALQLSWPVFAVLVREIS